MLKPETKYAALAVALIGFATASLQASDYNPSHAKLEYSKRFTNNQLAPNMEPSHIYYVSPDAKESGDGSRETPFKSLEAARDAIRTLKAGDGLPLGGIQISLLPGDYHRDTSFSLDQQDSGTAEAPIVYHGLDRTAVTVSSGIELDVKKLKRVKDSQTWARLKEESRNNVFSISIPEIAWKNFPGNGEYGMIAMDGHMLTLAQWPNRGYNHIDEILETGPTTRWLKPDEKPAPYSKENPTGGKFTTQETLSPLVQKEFERSGDMQAQGYFHNDWFFQPEQVGRIEGKVVQLLRYTRYGILDKIKTVPRRVRLVNVLAELDEPGEWYFDKIDKKLYLWPIPSFDKKSSRLVILPPASPEEGAGLQSYSVVPTYSEPGTALFELSDTSYVTLRNITFENSGNLAIRVSGGEYNLVASCTVRNGTQKGIAIEGGTRNGITGSDFYNLESAFSITGGDFASLERCYNFATNNDIHSCRRRGYGMINLDGVGLYFAHNVLHDMNGAVNYKTVDALIEYNEFYNVGYEMGDFNVAYCGAVWYTMNNVVRFNLVHHLLEPGGHPIFAFRNDDGGMGLQIHGNVFYRSGRGGGQFHGPLNSFTNNIAMKVNTMWWGNKRPKTDEEVAAAWKNLEKFGRDLPHGDKGDNIYIMEQFLGKEGWKKSPWVDEFPQLAKAIDTNPFSQTFCRISDNYIHEVRRPLYIHGGDGTIEGLENKTLGERSDLPESGYFTMPAELDTNAFVDVPTLNFAFKDDFEPMEGFSPIPFEKIGFETNGFRPNPPNKEEYRATVYQRFLNDQGGRYDAEQVNARYPTPSYLK